MAHRVRTFRSFTFTISFKIDVELNFNKNFIQDLPIYFTINLCLSLLVYEREVFRGWRKLLQIKWILL